MKSRFFNKIKDLWNNRTKNLYIIQEIENNEVSHEYYFKKSSNRSRVYENLIILDCAPHYNLWCECHDYEVNDDSWTKYLQTVYVPDNKYFFVDGQVVACDIRYKHFSYEAAIAKEKAKIQAKIKQKKKKKK